MKMQNEIFLKSAKSAIRNKDGDYIGQVAEVTIDSEGKNLEYLILRTEQFFGSNERFFAIPVCPELITIDEGGTIILKADKDKLQFARGISVNKCPKPKLEFGSTIYELYNYNAPRNSTKKT